MEQKLFCSNCGAENKPEENFCGYCGSRVIREGANKSNELMTKAFDDRQSTKDENDSKLDWFDKLLVARDWAVSIFCFAVAIVCLVKLEILVALTTGLAGLFFYPKMKDKVSWGLRITILIIICLLVSMGL